MSVKHTYIYLSEGAIHIKDMSVEEYQERFETLHLLHRFAMPERNFDSVTVTGQAIAIRSKLQLIDHREG